MIFFACVGDIGWNENARDHFGAGVIMETLMRLYVISSIRGSSPFIFLFSRCMEHHLIPCCTVWELASQGVFSSVLANGH